MPGFTPTQTSIRTPLGQYLFEFVWWWCAAWTPKPFNGWRLFILRCFGAKVSASAFGHPRARITRPWNLRMAHRAALGDRAHAYCLATISLQDYATVAQEAYLCTGSHDFTSPLFPQPETAAPIEVGPHAFVGLRAIVLGGVSLGEHSQVAAGSVVTRSVPHQTTVRGVPAR